MKILIVEDNPLSARVLESTLKNHGYDTLGAQDGSQAIEQLHLHPEIDIVITDVAMPNTNGVELLKLIKQKPEWREIPVIVCTSMNTDVVTMIEEAAQESADVTGFRYLLKPIQAESLLQTVKLATEKRRPVMQNRGQIMARLGVDEQGLIELATEYLKTVEDAIDVLNGKAPAIATLNFDDLMEGAKLLGAERLANAIDRHLEENNMDPEGSGSKAPVLLHEFMAIYWYLERYSAKSPAPSLSARKVEPPRDHPAS